MREIDLVKVLQNLVKHFWLPVLLAFLGTIGMFLAANRSSTWNLICGYSVEADNRENGTNDFYSYEENLAEAVCQQLRRDAELKNLTVDTEYYWIERSNRRIEVKAKAKNKDAIVNVNNLFTSKASEYLDREAEKNAVLNIEYCDLAEEQAPRKKMALFGGTLGLCVGLSILLLNEYIHSPKEAKRTEESR